MKFTNGYWLMKSNIKQSKACVVYDVNIFPKKIIIFLPFRPVTHRYESVDTGLITMEITAPTQDSFSINAYHYSGGTHFGKSKFNINDQELSINVLENSQTTLVLQNGNAKLVINKEQYEMKLFYKDQFKTSSNIDSLNYLIDNNTNKSYMKDSLLNGVGDYVYGLGEHFTSFVKNGQIVNIWNEDGGTGSEQGYKNIPFYLTNKNYGVFVNHKGRVSFEIGSEVTTRNQFSVEGEELNYILFAGDNMKDVIKKFNTLLTGNVPVPPIWSFGLWLSTSFTTQYKADVILGMIDKMAENNIKISVFHIDTLWMKPFQLCDFEFDPAIGQDPKELIDAIHSRGIKVCFWINSYVSQKSKLFEEGKQKGYFIKRKDGSVWQWDLWQPGNAFIDFTNPNACKWYQKQLKKWLDLGVDCYKTDFGERIPFEDAVFFNGNDPKLEHNNYTYLFNKCVFDLLKQEKGENEAIVFARSGTFGSQEFPVHWGGDCLTNFNSMAESLRGGLSFLSSGFSFWSHDMGGFEGNNNAPVYKRWCQFGIFSSHSRLHGNKEYRVPWIFDNEAPKVLSKYYTYKLEMMPYIYSGAVECANKRLPFMHPMVFEFQNDWNTKGLDTQYMFGESYLVAPIFNEEGNVDFYLPTGKWYNLTTNKIYEGNQWYHENYSYMDMPLFARQNRILLNKKVKNTNDFDFKLDKELVIKIYINGDFTDSVDLYTEGAIKTDTFQVEVKDNLIRVENHNIEEFDLVIISLKTGKETTHHLFKEVNVIEF